MISQFEERLSDVPRWSIVRTIQKQSVAEHSFRVAVMAPRIAVLWLGSAAAALNEQMFMYRLVRYALLHDQHEAFLGDIPTPAGRHLDKKSAERDFDLRCIEAIEPTGVMKAIVKTADLIEALVFLYVDASLGNTTLDDIVTDVETNLKAHLVSNRQRGLIGVLLSNARSFAKRKQDPLSDRTIKLGDTFD